MSPTITRSAHDIWDTRDSWHGVLVSGAGADVGQGLAGLRRVAFLLERQLAPTYRVKAFRTAASALEELPADEVARRVHAGTLTDLAGVGPKTSQVFADCSRGEHSEYLAGLESADAPDPGGGAELLAALRGDLHVHSDWSDGGSPILEMAVTALSLGHDYMALTDHSPTLRVANGLTASRLREQLEVVARINAELSPFRLLTGIEVDILEDGSLDQDPELLALLDVVVASVHSKLRSPGELMTRRMVSAIANPNMPRRESTSRSPSSSYRWTSVSVSLRVARR